MFKWAASEQLVPASVYHALKTVERLKKGRTTAHETTPVRPVEDKVIEATLPLLPMAVADMVQFQRLKVVNLGDDADTTGAVCGQLAGACWGETGIPAEWLEELVREDMIE